LLDSTHSWIGYLSLAGFILAYVIVIFEEKLHLRKSKPVVFMGCFMWMLIGISEFPLGEKHAHEYLKELIAEIGELFFFLLVAMTYINVLSERNVFQVLRAWLLRKGMGFRSLFWATGGLAFCLSPLADNLTTALLMSTVALAVGEGNKKFIVPAFINIVVAANAGGAWSPFGDITTLMVWTSHKVETLEFSYLFLPSLVNWLVPALIMAPFIPKEKPDPIKETVTLKHGAKFIIFLGILTISTAVAFHQVLDLPPYLGMMMGLSLLMFVGFYLKERENSNGFNNGDVELNQNAPLRFDVFRKVQRVEFDTLLFFFGVLTAVGALQFLGYLALVSNQLYGNLGPTLSNICVGVLSAVVDNIPVMFAVLKMNPDMGLDQWLLITLTAGVGGSLLSVGSAAGVAVMGVDRKNYTFLAHLKFAPVIAIGYLASIGCWWVVTTSLR